MYSPGCLIVALYGQGKTRGQISGLKISATINQACAAITLIEETEEHREYIRYLFKKKYEEIRALAAGGAQPTLM
jgi:type I restriction enzyme S subunit